jgi:hypothetical protein
MCESASPYTCGRMCAQAAGVLPGDGEHFAILGEDSSDEESDSSDGTDGSDSVQDESDGE